MNSGSVRSCWRNVKRVVVDVLDVLQRPGVEVVDADHAVALGEQVSHMCEPRNPAPPRDDAGGHGGARIRGATAGGSQLQRAGGRSGVRGGERRLGVEPHVDPSAASTPRRRLAARAHAPALRRCARRVSLCPDDADDALQRATLILLTKAPPHPPARLAGWMYVVTRREALARAPQARAPARRRDSATFIASAPGPAERAERRERLARRAACSRRLKPDERRALVLQAQGYSYARSASSPAGPTRR